MSSQELTAVSSANATAATQPRRGGMERSDAELRETATKFEAAFLAEMLKAAKIGETKGPFSGGYGAETFRSFLVREYADALAEKNTFGLAEKIYSQLKQKVASDAE